MASTIQAAAHVVGNAFVNQYYNVLHQSPHVVHRFYTDASRLTRAEVGPEGAVESVMNQAEIHNKVMSLDYGDCRAEIKTVDSQESFTGAVLVMVTGALYKNNGKRNFVQSFFLAPQERGYYVLNDIFRYLDEDPQVAKPVYAVANGTPETLSSLQTASETEYEVRDLSPSPPSEEEAAVEDMLELAEHAEISEVEEAAIEDRGCLETVEAVSNEQLSVSDDPLPAPVEEVNVEKKSYASILRVARDNLAAGAQPALALAFSRQAPGNTEHPVASQQYLVPSSLSATTQVVAEVLDESAHLENEADVRSVYVKNLHINITSLQLEDEFGRFGPIKPNSVNVRSHKQGGCYAFVDFEDPNSAQSAIEASPILIGGRPAYIEEKRSTSSGGGGGGRLPHGRGTFRNGGMRGRGLYAGHGFARSTGQERDRDVSNRGRGRGSGPVRGGYGGSNTDFSNNSFGVNSSSADSYRRTNPQGGNESRPPRRGAGNQM